MKKIVVLMLALCLLLCGCSRKFAKDAVIGGVPVGGLTQEEALAVLEKTAEDYTLKVTLDGAATVLDARQLGVTFLGGKVGETPQQVFSAAPFEDLLTLLRGVKEDVQPISAPIYYSEAEKKFVPGEGTDGIHWDYTDAISEILRAADALEPEVTVSAKEEVLTALPGDQDPVTVEALEAANGILFSDIQFCEVVDGEKTECESLAPERVAGWLTVEEDGMTVSVSREGVAAYAAALAEDYSVPGAYGLQFLTYDGRSIVLEEPTGKYWVDADALTEEILRCLGTSAQIELPFLPEGQGPMNIQNFGGTYVEVDIPNQMVYCYEDGELLIATPCVTGCVANGDDTPTGIYRFYHLSRNAWLEGPTWLDWVDCWMAFYGGYGMHDANWRDEFGGDIYLENGSHGCVNLPPEAAPVIYGAITYGTYIILY